VRGGSPAENVFFVDNIPFVNINYFPKQGASGGPISYINIAQVKSMNFYTGGFDGTFNALSSVIDISLRDGNSEQFGAHADFNMIGLGATAEGPLGGGSSYYVSASRGYLDLLKGLLGQSGTPRWANAQGKVSLNLGNNDKISILGFSAFSDFLRDTPEGLETNTSHNVQHQQNHTYGMNWRHIADKIGFANTSLSFVSVHGREWSRVPQNDSLFWDNDYVEQALHLRNVSHLLISSIFTTDAGFDGRLEWHTLDSFVPSSPDAVGGATSSRYLNTSISAVRWDFFASLHTFITDKLKFSAGGRVESASYGTNRTLETVLLPRLSANYQLSDVLMVSAAWGKFSQPLSMGILQYSIDTQFPSKPIIATHFVGSIAWLAREDMRITFEAYQKDYENMPLDTKQPYRFPIDDAVGDFDFQRTTSFLFTGTARARGIEVSLQKKMSESFYATIGTTLMRSSYIGLDGVERNRLYDNRFVGNCTIGWKITDEWEVGFQLAAMGGNAYTPLNDSASKSSGKIVYSVKDFMQSHLPLYKIVNLRVDKRIHFASSSIVVYLTMLNAFNLSNVKNIEWNPYSRVVNTTNHIGLLPILGVEWFL
jgi:hypothetical protein